MKINKRQQCTLCSRDDGVLTNNQFEFMVHRARIFPIICQTGSLIHILAGKVGGPTACMSLCSTTHIQ